MSFQFVLINIFARFLYVFVVLVASLSRPSISGPCYPSDPTGSNPQNPCLVYPPPGISPDSFIQGDGLPVRELPTVQNPVGQLIVRPSGYWSGSTTSGQSRVIVDSTGNVYSLPK